MFKDMNSRYGYGEKILLEYRDAIKNIVYNFLKTPVRSVPFRRAMGNRAEEFLQNPLDTVMAYRLEGSLLNSITQQIPRIEVKNGDITVTNVGFDSIEVSIRYRVVSTDISDEYKVIVNRG